MIIPANINHTNLEQCALALHLSVKSMPTSEPHNSSHLDEEVDKLNLAVKYGADTVMDLSRVGNLG